MRIDAGGADHDRRTVTSIAADSPSARSAIPSGGAQPPSDIDQRIARPPQRGAMANATPSPSGMVSQATRCAWRPPSTNAEQQPDDRQHEHEHQQEAAGVGRSEVRRLASASLPGRRLGAQAWPTRLLEQPQQQRDRQGGGREGHDDAGDHQRLRHRIAAQPGGRAAAGDDAEQQEDAAADQVEGEDLAQRMRTARSGRTGPRPTSTAAQSPNSVVLLMASSSVPAGRPAAGPA